MGEDIRSEEYGTLQALIDSLYFKRVRVNQIELIVRAESVDLCSDLLEICGMVPAGTYSRRRLCDQLNSCIVAHGWGSRYGTVE